MQKYSLAGFQPLQPKSVLFGQLNSNMAIAKIHTTKNTNCKSLLTLGSCDRSSDVLSLSGSCANYGTSQKDGTE